MTYAMKPLGCDPARIKGMSERLIVSHYENNYGGTVKRLNARGAACRTRFRVRARLRRQWAQARTVDRDELDGAARTFL